jgi:transposase-like protein
MRKYSSRMRESKFKEIYLQYKASGCTKEEFCKSYGYTKSSFYYWLRKWGDGSDIKGNKKTSQLAPIMLIGNATNEVGQVCGSTEHTGRSSMELVRIPDYTRSVIPVIPVHLQWVFSYDF